MGNSNAKCWPNQSFRLPHQAFDVTRCNSLCVRSEAILSAEDSKSIEIWIADTVDTDSEFTELNALPGPALSDGGRGMTVLRRVSVSQDAVKEKVAEMGTFITGLLDGWSHSRVRLDEVSFTLEVSPEGIVKWVLGAGVKGGASIKFKIDPK